MKNLRVVLMTVLLLLAGSADAGDALLMARSKLAFPEAMLKLQESIQAHGYTLARVQRVDIGLTNMGYQTDKYRIVFFGKLDEIRRLSTEHPDMIPYLPTNIAIFAEQEQTLLVSLNPSIFKEMVHDQETSALFDRWESDVRSILRDVRRGEE